MFKQRTRPFNHDLGSPHDLGKFNYTRAKLISTAVLIDELQILAIYKRGEQIEQATLRDRKFLH